MNQNIKAIETIYNGYRFRSRAEARWAVFFDACGIKYEYEPEGFRLSDGTMYLPDFYLPESKTYIEVKGIMSDTDMHKITQFQNDMVGPVVIGYSDMSFKASDQWEGGFSLTSSKSDSYFCKCYDCGKYYFIAGCGSYRCLNCGYHDGDSTFDLITYGEDWGNTKRYNFEPFRKAMQARFEHGERG